MFLLPLIGLGDPKCMPVPELLSTLISLISKNSEASISTPSPCISFINPFPVKVEFFANLNSTPSYFRSLFFVNSVPEIIPCNTI